MAFNFCVIVQKLPYFHKILVEKPLSYFQGRANMARHNVFDILTYMLVSVTQLRKRGLSDCGWRLRKCRSTFVVWALWRAAEILSDVHDRTFFHSVPLSTLTFTDCIWTHNFKRIPFMDRELMGTLHILQLRWCNRKNGPRGRQLMELVYLLEKMWRVCFISVHCGGFIWWQS